MIDLSRDGGKGQYFPTESTWNILHQLGDVHLNLYQNAANFQVRTEYEKLLEQLTK